MRTCIALMLLLSLPAGCVPAADNVVEDVWSNRAERQDVKRRSEYVQSHPGLSEEKQNAILEGDVLSGMLQEEVLASWGYPARESRIDIDGRAVRVWEYGTVGATFEKGVLTGFRDLGPR